MARKLKTVEPAPEAAADILSADTTTTQIEPAENTDFSSVDPLLKEQKMYVDQMRSALISCNKTDLNSTKRAIQNITVMRIYHQIARIIKFTEMMDLLEDKLYESMIANIGEMDSYDPATLLTLMKVQAQLQETMVQSQLLIKPYLEMDIESIAPPQEFEETSFGAAIISQESRNNIRNGAQALLTELRKSNPELPVAAESEPKKVTKKRGRKPKKAKSVENTSEDTNVRSASAE